MSVLSEPVELIVQVIGCPVYDLSGKTNIFQTAESKSWASARLLGSARAQLCKCGPVIDVLGLCLVTSYTVNPLLSPPQEAYLFQAHFRGP